MEPLVTECRPVVRLELRGGLGNQLFQASAAMALASRLNATLQFDVSHFRGNGARGYALSPFPHGAELVTLPRSFLNRFKRRSAKLARHAGLSFVPGWWGNVLREESYAYDDRIERVRNSCYLAGYFQSWRYFSEITDVVRRTFDPDKIASAAAREFATGIGPNALSVHVRAGDYKANPGTEKVHGTLSAEYYSHAIALARRCNATGETYCFTDSPAYAQELLQGIKGLIIVEGFSMYDDMYLMSRCSAHVIANSTFSYWSAYLDARQQPFVIAPSAWFAPEELKRVYVGDLYPSGWILL